MYYNSYKETFIIIAVGNMDKNSETELPINYKLLIDYSLLDVIKRALQIIERDQVIPKPHYFYLDFLTNFPGVKIPKAIKEKYPHTITVVIQHQFKDLIVHKDKFDITLSFSEKDVPLTIPFKAITHFIDPAAGLELEFNDDIRQVVYEKDKKRHSSTLDKKDDKNLIELDFKDK